jgi:hypothetical protein
MIQILARQLIYTRVEEAYSPAQKSGYQTFYSSPDLKKNIADLIVKKVSEFQPQLPNLKRWQCFFLENSSGVVITQTQLIDSDPEIVDKDSRPGILVAHCLVLDWDDYKRIGCEPFRIIEQFQFVASAKEMVQLYNQNEGKESQAYIDILEHTSYDVDSSWKENAYQLALTAVPQFVKGNNSVLLYGEDKEIYETLKAIYFYVPPSYRENLTFDTYVKGKQVSAGEFWAVGLPEWKTSYNIAINTSTKKISGDPKHFDDLYLLWLNKNAPKNLNSETVAAVQEISDSFARKRVPTKDHVSKLALESFHETHQQVIFNRVLNVTNQILGKNLSLPFVKYLEGNYPLYDFISVASSELFPLNKFVFQIREWFISLKLDFGKFSSDDWAVIKQLSLKARDNCLTLWYAAFTGDKKLFQVAVKALTSDEYAYALLLISQPLKPLSLFVPIYTSQFVSALSAKSNQLSEGEFVELINEILNTESHKELDNMDGFVSHLSNKELTHLEKITAKKQIPSKFRFSIEKRRSQIGQPYTIIDAVLRRK